MAVLTATFNPAEAPFPLLISLAPPGVPLTEGHPEYGLGQLAMTVTLSVPQNDCNTLSATQ